MLYYVILVGTVMYRILRVRRNILSSDSANISKEFMTSSEVYGKPVITHLEGDEYDLELNET